MACPLLVSVEAAVHGVDCFERWSNPRRTSRRKSSSRSKCSLPPRTMTPP